jgi:HEAT repeat protein
MTVQNPSTSLRASLQSLITNLTSGDDQIAENAVGSIAALGESALPTLFGLLDSADPDRRWWALRALAEIPHPEVPPRLRSYLDDPDPDVRQCAALGLSEQPWTEAIPDLVKALDDEDRLLARLAGDALIAIGSPAVSSLIEALESGTPSAQIEAARSLALIGNPEAIPALFKAWQAGSSMIQHWCEEGFERMGVGMQFFRPD